jgi:tetratricopeptide (TPR) repeat protein
MRDDEALTTEDPCPASDELRTACEYPASVKSRRVLEHARSCNSCTGLLGASPSGNTSASDVSRDEAPADAPKLEPGTVVGRYMIERAIGEGGMGVVFEAADRELQRKVAIKLLSPRTGAAARLWQERLLREARAMARVSHPNVVPIYDIGAHGHQVFIAMELVAGLTLRDWLSSRQHTWEEIVDVFRDVGRGLAAVHDVELVHRDVKPDNILVGNDGRARLTDFGVVKEVGDTSAESSQESSDGAPPERKSQPLGPHLTRIGTIIGTVGYMAPEQLNGQAADPRTDQFSFCATFHRALYGVNPCRKREQNRLEQWRVPDAPEGSRVPLWVRKIVVRGLSADPNLRYPSMRALLSDLRHDVRRARVIPLVALGIGAGCAAALLMRDDNEARACPDQRPQLANVWDAPTKRTIRDAFLATKKPYAEASFHSVERILDGYAESWVKTHAGSCEKGERNEARRDCLALRLDDLRAQTELFVKADVRTVELAVGAAGSLLDPADCAHAVASSVRSDAPGRGLRTQLSAVKALEDLGKYPEGINRATAVVEQARALKDRVVEAEALFQLGELQRRNGDTNAGRSLEQAIMAAVASRHDEVAARAWIRLASFAGIEKGQLDEGLRLAQHGRAFIERLGGDPRLEAMLAGDLGIIYRRLGRYDESLQHFDRAIELGTMVYGPAHTTIGGWINSAGLTLLEAGKYAEARTRFQRALAIFEKEFGPHPRLATVYVNLGLERFRSGDFEQAAAFAKRSLEIDEREGGPGNSKLVSTLNLIGSSYSELGRHDEGIAALQRAVELTQSLPEQNHKRLAAEVSLAIAYKRAGRFKEALPLFEHALPILDGRTENSDPSDVAETRFGLAETVFALGQKKRGVALAVKAREGFVAAGDKMKRHLGDVDAWLAAHAPKN